MRFSDTTIKAARLRQWGRCGYCGEVMDNLWEEAHHIVPIRLGGTNDVENCAILCHDCQSWAHHDGRFRSAFVMPKEGFPYFEGR